MADNPQQINVVHAWLDSAGFWFRDSLGSLVSAYGLSDSGRWHRWPLCAPSSSSGFPIIAAPLVRPFGFHVTDYSSHDDALDEFYGVVDCGSQEASFESAHLELSKALGSGGATVSVTGAPEVNWVTGPSAVRLSTTEFPAGTHPGHGALVEVWTGWRPQLSVIHCDAIMNWQAAIALVDDVATTFAPPDVTFDWPTEFPSPPTGIGVLALDGSLAIVSDDGLVIISRARLRHVGYTLIHPARSSGSEEVAVHYEADGFHGPVARKYVLTSSYQNGAYRDFAQDLARCASLPLAAHEFVND